MRVHTKACGFFSVLNSCNAMVRHKTDMYFKSTTVFCRDDHEYNSMTSLYFRPQIH